MLLRSAAIPFRSAEALLRLREEALGLGLNGPGNFWNCSLAELQMAYNGIGAAWQSRLSRKLQTALFSEFEVVALIHDYAGEFHNDHSRAGFDEWNRRYWIENVGKLCRARYAWFRPRRYTTLFRGFLLYRALQRFGLRAWLSQDL